MKKLLALILVLVMCVSMFTACGSKGETADAPSESKQDAPASEKTEEAAKEEAPAAVEGKDTLVVAVSTGPGTLDPNKEGILYTSACLRLVYDGLVRMTKDNEFVPHLAESYEAISDTEWKFVLRDGLTFSDGTPVTSEDCAASIWATHDSAVLYPYATWLDKIEIIDDKTFVIHTLEPSTRIIYDLSHYHWIIPASTIGCDYDYDSNPVGTGPYTLVEWQRGDHLLFEAREDYFLAEDAARIKYLDWRIVPEGISRTIALQNGEVDFVYDVNATDLPQLEADENVTVYNADYCSPFYMAFNLNNEYLSDINVRKAVASAINRENASAVATNSYSKPINTCFALDLLGSTQEYAYGYDVEAAKQYMAEAGYPDGGFTLNVITKEAVMKTALESVQADLKEIGITLEIELMDGATYTARSADFDFDMIVGKYGIPDLLIYAQNAFLTGAPYNYNGLEDPELDALINEGFRTIDEAARAEIIDQVVEKVDSNVYRTGIYQLTTTRAFSSKLAGFETTSESKDRFNKMYWAE